MSTNSNILPNKKNDDTIERERDVKAFIYDVTHSGKEHLDASVLKQLKSFSQLGKSFVHAIFDSVFEQLQAQQSQIRLTALLLINELFQRSSYFRDLLLDHLQEFFVYSLETDPLHFPLPGPEKTARLLKHKSLCSIHDWESKFGPAYKKLQLGCDYLRQCKHFDYVEINEQNRAQRERRQLEELRNRSLEIAARDRVQLRFDESKADVERSLSEMDSAFSLLFPNANESVILADDAAESARAHGQVSCTGPDTLELRVNLRSGPRLMESQDNAAVIDALRDNYKLITNNYLPLMQRLLAKLGKISSKDQTLLKQLIDMKSALQAAREKFEEMNIFKAPLSSADDADDTSDSDLEEVQPKEGYEPNFVDDTVPNYIFEAAKRREEAVHDAMPSTSKKSERFESTSQEIPILQYGLDLKYWEADKIEPAETATFDSTHRFWRPPDSEPKISADSEEVYRTRVIQFPGKFEPSKRLCKAPLQQGGLCQRKDRNRCPFHGIIVDRDEQGQPLRPEDARASSSEEPVPEWQDPVLLRELEAQTGVDLTVGNASKGKKRQGSLVDVKALDTARKRIQKRVLDGGSVRRIAEAMNKQDKAKFGKKYSDNWNSSAYS